MAQSNLVSWF